MANGLECPSGSGREDLLENADEIGEVEIGPAEWTVQGAWEE
jgi:hypothetical protein